MWIKVDGHAARASSPATSLDSMELAGLEIARPAVLELVDLLNTAGHDDTSALLLIADASGEERVGLSITDREAILSVLSNPRDGLLELRSVMLAEHVGRVRDGLSS